MKRPEDYDSITTLDISSKKLKQIPSWVKQCYNLKKIMCSCNQLTQLDNLPSGLIDLYCAFNKITHLDNLPQTLEILDCGYNKITQLDNLPQTLKNYIVRLIQLHN
jgi:Leucine-rich repeat (LRR) protein